MGRQHGPAGPRWLRLLRAGGRRFLRLCGTALRGLRRLWSLAWVGTAQPCPGELPKPLPAPRGARGRGAAGVRSLHRCCGGLAGGGVQSLHRCCCGGLAGVAAGAGGAPHRNTRCGSGTLLPGLLLGSRRRVGVVVPTESPGDALGTPLRALRRVGVSPPLPQVLLMCYKSCWDGAFQVTEEVTPGGRDRAALHPPGELSPVTAPAGWHRGGSPGRAGARGHWAQLPLDLRAPTIRVGFQLGTALQLRLEGSEEEEEKDVDSDSAWEPGRTGQWHGGASEAMLGRLEALEADVRFLCTELGAEKLLWSSRFLELLREQQSLRQRLQELPWRWNSGDSPELLGEAEDQSASGSEGESPEGRGWELWRGTGNQWLRRGQCSVNGQCG
ncbi:uncharacterized protein LOC121342823 isoform X2 [Onychostruthus taczanowskii]|uniref:uncharacterized protein LOC121342823 isoform X2 n=1 Tax=Onychostruthus taczanowskii TaxID=356909 RepID=UPI001B8067D4|nr:uncharacterized protein LOC121342823 isoform X2 [Onychostruthus taczanowskii]